MNTYSLTLLVKNDLDEKARGELLSSITKNFGKLDKEDLWGTRNLAYPIKHNDKAFYAYYEFSSQPNTIAPLDKIIKFNEDILRYLLLRTEERKVRTSKKQKTEKSEKTEKLEVAQDIEVVETSDETTSNEAVEKKPVKKKIVKAKKVKE